MSTFTSELRRAIEADARSLSRLAEAAGIDKGQVARFVNKQRTWTLGTADAMLAGLGLECKLIRRRGAKGGKR